MELRKEMAGNQNGFYSLDDLIAKVCFMTGASAP
jgi:hypothetical protein